MTYVNPNVEGSKLHINTTGYFTIGSFFEDKVGKAAPNPVLETAWYPRLVVPGKLFFFCDFFHLQPKLTKKPKKQKQKHQQVVVVV